MKLLKQKMYYVLFVLLVGIGFIIINFLTYHDDTLMGLGLGFLVIGLCKLVQYYRISKDPEKIKQLELIQGEERLVYISHKSMAATFYLSIIFEYIAMAVFLALGKSDVITIICFITALQCCCYVACHVYFSKKY